MLQKKNLESVFGTRFIDDGEDYKALCPYHEERTPSFYVHKHRYICHCFGCGAKGHVIDLTKKLKGVDEKEAQELLGITPEQIIIPLFNQTLPVKEDPRIYPESWLAPFRKEIHAYTRKRGFSISTLREAGALYDHSTQRQVFPHRNREGRLVGAIGRACKYQQPKWYFYWGYEKGRYLYRTLQLSQSEPVWIVEGVFDALWLYQHGLSACATLGSKPTRWQIQEIIDNYDEVVLAYDNDAPGIDGTEYLLNCLSCTCLLPRWPREANDVMDVDPRKLKLVNVVQREFILASKEWSRVPRQQETSLTPA